jgi:hypothetical protein
VTSEGARKRCEERFGWSRRDPHVSPLGVKGVGEIAIVGVAAAMRFCHALDDSTTRRDLKVDVSLPNMHMVGLAK